MKTIMLTVIGVLMAAAAALMVGTIAQGNLVQPEKSKMFTDFQSLQNEQQDVYNNATAMLGQMDEPEVVAAQEGRAQ